MGRFAYALITPDFSDYKDIVSALLKTLAFTFTGVTPGAIGGFLLALVFENRLIHTSCAVLRSTPEYLLAYIFLQLWGPSMLPAVIALMLHNGAIIGHLCGRYAKEVVLPVNPVSGFNLYAWEIVPRIYPQFLAFLFYRREIIFRETAILGMLGIYTLGFYVDSAFEEIRYDRALLLIAITAVINIGIDSLSRRIRRYLRLNKEVQCG